MTGSNLVCRTDSLVCRTGILIPVCRTGILYVELSVVLYEDLVALYLGLV